MTIERTVPLARPTSFVARLLASLSLAPHDAAAAAIEGAALRIALHPDGRHLYVAGSAWWPEGDGQYRSSGFGLLLVDVETGAIEAELSEGLEFSALEPAPDGRSLYVIEAHPSTATGTTPTGRVEARRLDAATLATLATREVDLGTRLEIIPTAVLAAVGATPTGR